MSALDADSRNVDARNDSTLPDFRCVPVRCFVSSCGPNQLVSCSSSGVPMLPEGWVGVRIVVARRKGRRDWFACPQHVGECQQSFLRDESFAE